MMLVGVVVLPFVGCLSVLFVFDLISDAFALFIGLV